MTFARSGTPRTRLLAGQFNAMKVFQAKSLTKGSKPMAPLCWNTKSGWMSGLTLYQGGVN
ncbi:hypothetical protein ACLEPN_04695 [Myxococcus sp. 1LA]